MAQLLDSGPADNVGQSTKSGTGLDGRGVDPRENQRPKRPKSKWHLGIRSQSNHQHVMKEVYRLVLILFFEFNFYVFILVL